MAGGSLHTSAPGASLKTSNESYQGICAHSSPHGEVQWHVPSSKTNIVFPSEIFEHIADKMIEFALPESTGVSIRSRKPPFTAASGFLSASAVLRHIGMTRWMRVVIVRAPEDWGLILKWAAAVRELECLAGVLALGMDKSILGQFPHVHTISINAHNDVFRNQTGRFSYRDVFNTLPTSLRRLEVTCAHGPDLKVIETVKRCCPNIEVMRLSRCTMFNRSPACEFWVGFPFDHDAYIAADGTDDYAYSVAQELASLEHLKTIRLGVYLVPSTIVLAHRVYHIKKQAAPVQIEWQQALMDLREPGVETDIPPGVSQLIELYHQKPEEDFGPDACDFCRDAFLEAAKNAEYSASNIMKKALPSLETVEWMNWFTPSHHGISSYFVGSPT